MASLVVVVVVAWLSSCGARPHRDVLTRHGAVRGYLTHAPQPPHYAFLGVPYARPTRHHRFKAPKPPRPWDGIFEATHRVRCPQPDGSGAEDCLVANVFAPQSAATLPVLVLVHGGNFQDGWGSARPPTRLLAKDFVVVTFNYRVGVFGFLCMGIPEAPGNAGLKDQVAALYWVHKNIGSFGGNPYDVTVYGIGSGAAAVQLLLLSGATRGLFHKAIIESGSALSPLSLSYDPLLTAMDVAAALGYRGKDTAQDLAVFYNQIPSKKLVNISSLFLPCLENNLRTTHSLLVKDPLETLKVGNYQMVPMLIAYKNSAGTMPFEMELKKLALLPENFEHMLPNNLDFDNDATKKRVAEAIRKFYMVNTAPSESVLQNYVDYINDVTYEYPIIKSSALHASTNPLPVYLMKFTIKKDSKNEESNLTQKPVDIIDYFYDNMHLTEKDETSVTRLVSLWSNFIKIGDPTPLTTFLVPMVWQPIKISEPNMRAINGLSFGESLKMTSQLVDERIIFWDQIYKKFYRTHPEFNYDIINMKI